MQAQRRLRRLLFPIDSARTQRAQFGFGVLSLQGQLRSFAMLVRLGLGVRSCEAGSGGLRVDEALQVISRGAKSGGGVRQGLVGPGFTTESTEGTEGSLFLRHAVVSASLVV
ncbi:MAG: hypothetical protein AUK47_19430 [Deltaproteobacteria bacterium CG2_30_63_29]|nr:MAG: hypothetical protein AUK47_19430 [Deltaproteobacteria bacterium CG2_30_63_29]